MQLQSVRIDRLLKDLRLAGAMELQRGLVIISDPLKLVQIAGFDANYLHHRLQAGRNFGWNNDLG